MKTWKNVPGSLIIEPGIVEDHLIDLDSEKSLDFLMPFINDPDRSEVVINFLSSGFYQHASMHGGPDGLGWPAEGEEDREFDSVEVLTDGLSYGKLPRDVAEKLFEMYRSEIDDIEIDWD